MVQSFRGHTCDFADRAAVYRLLDALRAGPPIDVLVNNAGTIRRSPAAEHGDDDWDTVLEVNLTAQFVLTREIGGRMLERGGGKIVFVASLLSFQGGITRSRLRRQQGWGSAADESPRQRVGGARGQCQRGRPRVHRDRQHAGAPGRSFPLRSDSRAGSRPGAGARRTTSRGRCSFSPRPQPTTCTARFSPWTADGWRDDEPGCSGCLERRVVPVVVVETLAPPYRWRSLEKGACRWRRSPSAPTRPPRRFARSPPRPSFSSAPARSSGRSRWTRRSRRARGSS